MFIESDNSNLYDLEDNLVATCMKDETNQFRTCFRHRIEEVAQLAKNVSLEQWHGMVVTNQYCCNRKYDEDWSCFFFQTERRKRFFLRRLIVRKDI